MRGVPPEPLGSLIYSLAGFRTEPTCGDEDELVRLRQAFFRQIERCRNVNGAELLDVLTLEEPNFAPIVHSPDVGACLWRARLQPRRLNYATAYGLPITQAQDSRVKVEEVGTELFKRLVIHFRIEREV